MGSIELTMREFLSQEAQNSTEGVRETQSFCKKINKPTLNLKVHEARTLRNQGHFDKAMLNITEANRDQVIAIRKIQTLIPAIVQEIASESARRTESDPDIPAPDLKVLVPDVQAMANLASGDAVTPRERRTPRGHDALTGLIYRLEKIYGDLTGRQPRLSRHPVTHVPQGPLIRFLREALLLAFRDAPSDEAIAGHHRKIKDWQKQRKAA